MLNRKVIVAAVAAMSLGLGTACTIVCAQQTPGADKNPADIPDKNNQPNTVNDAEMQQKMAMQEKMKADLMSNFNDADFVMVASMANNDEIKAAEAAVATSSNDDVKMFAQHMIDDHTKAGDELMALAKTKNWPVSDRPDVKHMMAIREMKKLSGADFDKSYASTNVADHQDTIALFKLAEDKASDADLKAFAAKAEPTFEMHLKMAQDLQTKTGAVTMAK